MYLSLAKAKSERIQYCQGCMYSGTLLLGIWNGSVSLEADSGVPNKLTCKYSHKNI